MYLTNPYLSIDVYNTLSASVYLPQLLLYFRHVSRTIWCTLHHSTMYNLSSILPVVRLDICKRVGICHGYEVRLRRKKLLRPPSVKNYTRAYFSVVFLKYLRLCAYYFINNIIKSVIFNFLNFTPYAYHNTSVIERIRIITITI